MRKHTVWHFAPIEDGQPVMRYTGEPIETGRVYDCGTEPILCRVGYHGSTDLLDALYHAPGPYLSRRVIWGDVRIGADKVCGRYCEHLSGADMTEVLRRFARACALDVVVRYLRTGDESIRDAARDTAAAWDAARAKQRRRLAAMVGAELRRAQT